MPVSKLKRKVFHGWWVVLICSLIGIYGSGTFHYGFSAFVHPVAEELGWSMALISGAFSLYRLESGIVAPLTGFLLDRIGPKKLVISGAIFMGSGFIYLSQVNTVVPFYIACVLISIGLSLSAGTAMCAPLIGKWFVRERSKALGIYMASLGLGGLLVPVLSHLITLYGWRFTLLIVGPCTWLVALPLSFFLKHRPEDNGLHPDGEPLEYSSEALDTLERTGVSEVDFSLRNAMRTQAFWVLTPCFMAFQMTMASVFVHLIPYLITVGIESRFAALVVTFVTLAAILGKLVFGWLGDRVSKKWLLVIIFALQAVGILALTQVRSVMLIVPFLLAYAPGYGGAATLKPAIVGEYYGRKNLGTIYGIIQGISIIGGVAGPVIAGWLYDIRSSYYLALILLALVNIISALLLLILRRPNPQKPILY